MQLLNNHHLVLAKEMLESFSEMRKVRVTENI